MNQELILIVEDEPEISSLLAFNLDKDGFKTHISDTGLSACQHIGVETPDLILLDVMLPDFNGMEVLKLIRGHDDAKVSGIPIIMLTALATSGDRVKGLGLGADDYVTKPFSIEELILRIRRLLRHKKSLKILTEAGGETSTAQRVREFQDMVFHELANQLMIVRGYSDRLYRNGEILPQDKIRTYAGVIYKSSTHLETMAEEMLILRSVEEKRLPVEKHEIDLKELAKDLAELFKPGAEERGISLVVDVAECYPLMNLNRPSLKIVFSSLMENAIKYGRPGGKVLLCAAVLNDGGNAIYVEDDGIGIPEEDLEFIFDKFYRGANVAANVKGTGLGLHFAKTLVEASGGAISVTSGLGRGTRFKLLYPPSAAVKAA